MNTSESIRALRKANPRSRDDFAESVEAVAEAVRVRIADSVEVTELQATRPSERRRFVRIAAATALVAVAAAAAALLTLGSPRGGTVEDAVAAVERAATVSAASAERSGTAAVRITQDGRPWAGTTIRWHGSDLALATDTGPGALLVVDSMMYAIEEGTWVELGPPESIDPGSGTTPAEYLAAVREDVGGATLRRFAKSVGALTTQPLADGSTVYSGKVAAGLIARESGFKEGQAIRVFPFGYVAHGAAANPAALLDVAVTVGANGFVRELAVRWPGWVYSVTYSKLGATPAPVAPANARPLRRQLR